MHNQITITAFAHCLHDSFHLFHQFDKKEEKTFRTLLVPYQSDFRAEQSTKASLWHHRYLIQHCYPTNST